MFNSKICYNNINNRGPVQVLCYSDDLFKAFNVKAYNDYITGELDEQCITVELVKEGLTCLLV